MQSRVHDVHPRYATVGIGLSYLHHWHLVRAGVLFDMQWVTYMYMYM